MRVRCIALPHPDSNAVGVLELKTTESELVVFHLSVSQGAMGKANTPVRPGSQSRVPWSEVRAQRHGAEGLLLHLGAGRTALNQLCLSTFSRQDPVDRQLGRQSNWLARTGASLLGALVVLVVTLGFERVGNFELAAFTGLGMTGAVGLLLLLVGLSTNPRWGLNAPSPSDVLQALVSALNQHLADGVENAPGGTSRLTETTPSDYEWRFGRIAAVIGSVATLAAAFILWPEVSEPVAPAASVLSIKPSAPDPIRPPSSASVERTSAPLQLPTTEPGEATSQQSLRLGKACQCERPDSPLWASPILRLSPLLLAQETVREGGEEKTRLQLAVVNNGNTDLRQINVVVHFRDSAAPEKADEDRPLHYDGPLRPGRAIKWTVQAPGDSFQIEADDHGTLAPDTSNTAPAASFLYLTRANHRPVRLHAARMLARLNSDQAALVAKELVTASEWVERPYLTRIENAVRPVFACDVKLQPSAGRSEVLSGCLFNRSRAERSDLSLQIQASDSRLAVNYPTGSPPKLVQSISRSIRGRLRENSGRRFEFPTPFGEISSREIAQIEVVAGDFSEPK